MRRDFPTSTEQILEQLSELRAAVADLAGKVGEILEAVHRPDVEHAQVRRGSDEGGNITAGLSRNLPWLLSRDVGGYSYLESPHAKITVQAPPKVGINPTSSDVGRRVVMLSERFPTHGCFGRLMDVSEDGTATMRLEDPSIPGTAIVRCNLSDLQWAEYYGPTVPYQVR